MMRKLCTSLFLGFVCLLPAWASNPGEPLDCSDMILLEPGYTCTEWVPYRCEGCVPSPVEIA